ncbi:MAG: hypothetical protein IT436_08495 [Phycisphaerales bacterium]|nr:hypothetical protein [Phycisphaerales bacterium]
MNAGCRLVQGFIGAVTFFATPAGLITAAGLTDAALPTTASAQVKDVAPYHAVVTGDATPLRCADITGAYRVAELAKGQVVIVDGESPDWSRVAYPPKTGAFVRIEESQLDGSTVKLTQPSKLRAANAVSGFGASWKSLLNEPLAAGASLKLIETVKADDGTVQGYRVVAPDSARGFIAPSALRRATDAEIAAYKKSIGAPAETKPVEAKPAEPKPAETAPAENKPGPSDNSLLKPMTPEGTTPTQPPTQPTTQPENTPTVVEQKPVQPAAQTPPRAVGTLEALEVSFQKVRKEPVLEAELDPLIVEIDRAIEVTDKTKFPRRHAQLVQRRDYLKLQVDYRDRLRTLEEAKRRIDEARGQSQQRLAELEAQRVYTVVGQLLPSNVYDGKDLPLMYRLQAVGGVVPRTLGYVKPQEQLQLPAKLGMVVGLIGRASLDPSLRLNIFDAVRVDVLKAADTVAPASNSAPPENPPEPSPENQPGEPAADAGDGQPPQ